MKMTIEPAMANDLMSTPMNSSICSPMKKNNNMSPPETNVARKALMSPTFFLIDMMIGSEPSISITAKRVNDTVTIWEKSVFVRPFIQWGKIVTFAVQF